MSEAISRFATAAATSTASGRPGVGDEQHRAGGGVLGGRVHAT